MSSKFTVNFIGRFFVSLVRFFWSVKMASKINAFSSNFYPCTPFFGRFNFRNTFITRTISRRHFSVCTILNGVTLPQIISAIIGRISINMINQFGWPFPRYKKPSQPLSVIQTIINANANISMWMYATSRHAGLPPSSSVDFPREVSSFWVIIQKLKNALCCNFIFHFSNMSSQMTLVK